MKLAGEPNNLVRFKDDATAVELRAEVMRRLMILQEAGAIDRKGWNSESAGSWRRSIGPQRGVILYEL